ncbi:MAG: antibiotic biosynthesis monooxygenase [Alphaproteobacteria bacterium]|nr:MAG: antibiotic biosynthesis monooxygenase [Alphaproteobacteria bacterium]
MLVIAAEIRIPEENMDAMADLCRTMVIETMKEPTCITYAFSQDFSEAGLVRIFEAWESQEGLDLHFATPHMAAFQGGMAALKPKGTIANKYEVSSVVDMMA